MPMQAVKWVMVLVGLWLIVSPFVLALTGTGRWSNILVGLVVAGIGLFLRPQAAQA